MAGHSGRLGAKVGASEQEVSSVGWSTKLVGPGQGPDKSFRREYSFLEYYNSVRQARSADLSEIIRTLYSLWIGPYKHFMVGWDLKADASYWLGLRG